MIYLPVINCRADSTTNPLLFTHTKTRPMDARTDAEKKGSERSENQCVIARRERSKGWGLTRARSRAMGFIRRSPTVIRRSPSVARRSPSVIRRSPSVIRRSSLVARRSPSVNRRVRSRVDRERLLRTVRRVERRVVRDASVCPTSARPFKKINEL